MKLDGKEIAQKAVAQKKQNDELKKEPEAVENDIVDTGDHIRQMFSFIEAIHSKDPEKAHASMMQYAKSASRKPE